MDRIVYRGVISNASANKTETSKNKCESRMTEHSHLVYRGIDHDGIRDGEQNESSRKTAQLIYRGTPLA